MGKGAGISSGLTHTVLGFLYEPGDQLYDTIDFKRGLQIRYLGWSCGEEHFLLKYISRHYYAKYAVADFLIEGLTYPKGTWQYHSAMYGIEVLNA